MVVSLAMLGSARAATITWDGGPNLNGDWMNGDNWVGDVAPTPGQDDVAFAGTVNTSTNNNFPADSVFNNISFAVGADPFTLAGARVTLPTPLDAGAGTTSGGGITQNSASVQSISLPLLLAQGRHNLTTAAATGNLNLSGAVTRNAGGVVVFTTAGGAINLAGGTGLANDASGILGGWATIGNDWAALDGSNNVVPYAGYTDIATGAIASNPTSNVRYINDTAALTVADGTIINSLLTTVSGGNRNITITGTMRLGSNGGVYRTANSDGNETTTLTGGTLTANGGGVITLSDATGAGGFAATNNNLTIASTIADDGANPVAVNILGYTVLSNNSNSYSGGTVISQGRVQATQVNAFGGAGRNVTILPSGQAFLNNNGNFASNFIISGIGPTEQNGGQFLGAIRMNTGGTNISGQVTLAGNARISGGSGGNNVISGQITGPGRLELTAATGNNPGVTLSNTGNNWSGGLLLTNAGSADRQIIVKLGANNVIPDGASAGDITLNGVIGFTRFDTNGFSDTINGLSSAANVNNQVSNQGAAPSVLTVGGNNATANFGGVLSDISAASNLSIVKIGTGNQTLSGVNTHRGSTTVNDGTLTLANAAANNIASSPAINVGVSGTLSTSGLSGGGIALSAGQTLTNYGIVSGNVTASNATSTVKGTGSYNGTVTVSGGTLAPGASVGTVTINDLSMSSGTWQVELSGTSADSISANTATFTGGGITLAPVGLPTGTSYTVLTATTSLTGAPASITNPVLGRMSFALDTSTANTIKITQTGAAVALRWDNSAPATGNGVTWDVNNNQNWRNAGNSPDTFFDFDSVTFNDTNNGNYNVTVVGPVTPLSITVDNSAGDYSIGGGAIDGQTGVLKTGSRMLTLSGANTFSGQVAINGGTVSIAASNNLGNAAATNNIAMAGGTLQSTGAAVDLGATRTIALGTGGGTIDVTAANVLTVPGVISGGAADPLTKTGTGTLLLSAANAYTGETNVNAGTIQVTNSAALGPVATAADVNVAAGGAVDLGPAAQGTINFGTKVMRIAGSGVGGTGALTNSSGNTQLNAFNFITLDADATIGGHRMDIGRVPAPALGGVLDLNGKKLTLAMTPIGAGTQPFFGVLDEADVIGNGSIEVASGALGFEVDAQALAANVTGVTFLNTVAGAHLQLFRQTAGGVTAPMTFKGNNIIGGGTNSGIIGQVDSPMTLEGNVTLQGLSSGTPNATANNPIIIAGNIGENAGSFGLTMTGGGGDTNVTTLAGTNSYSGTTTISAGTLQIGGLQDNASTLTATTTNPAGPSGTLGTGPVVNNGILRFNRLNDYTAPNAISGTGAVQKFGAGTVSLGGVNTYSGTTTVNAGKLQVNGSHTNAGAYSVAAGASLGGSGSIAFGGSAGITVAAGGNVAPGASIGTLGLDSGSTSGAVLTMGANASFSMDLDNVLQSDMVAVSNATANVVDILFNNNVINFSDLSGGNLQLGTYTLFTANAVSVYGGIMTDANNVITSGLSIGTGLSAFTSYAGTALRLDGNNIVLTLVPEPASALLVLFGAVAIGLCARRRK